MLGRRQCPCWCCRWNERRLSGRRTSRTHRTGPSQSSPPPSNYAGPDSSCLMLQSSLPMPCSREGGLPGLPLRASNEGSPRPRVARAQEASRPPSLRGFYFSATSPGSGRIILQLSAWDEGLPRPRVPRARRTTGPLPVPPPLDPVSPPLVECRRTWLTGCVKTCSPGQP